MSKVENPNTPKYWRSFYVIQATLLEELIATTSPQRINYLAHKIATKVYNESI